MHSPGLSVSLQTLNPPCQGHQTHQTGNPGSLALWAFLDRQVFLIQEECYHGKPGGLSIGELPSGSLDDRGMC